MVWGREMVWVGRAGGSEMVWVDEEEDWKMVWVDGGGGMEKETIVSKRLDVTAVRELKQH